MGAIAFVMNLADVNGTPVSGAKANAYIKDTTTPQGVFTDSGLATPASNPVVADSAGKFRFYLNDTLSYTLRLTDASGATIYFELDYTTGAAEPWTITQASVAGYNSYVDTVSANMIKIEVVADNIVDVNTVAGSIADVNTVAARDADIQVVADNDADISTVADNIGDVGTVAGSIADVSTVAARDADIATVAANDADISTVADNIGDVLSVAAALPDIAGAVDDVQDFADLASFPATGSTSSLYVARDTGLVYVWSGSAYVQTPPPDSYVNKYQDYAALRANTVTPAEGQIAYVEYRTARGDGGGGHFRADTADTSTADNGGTILVDADGTRWKRIIEGEFEMIDPRWFGAKMDYDFSADTGTDDLAAFQAAFLAGNIVRMPPGSTLFSDKLTIPTNGALIGLGRTIGKICVSEAHATAAFNMSASGVVQLGVTEPGAMLIGVGFDFRHADLAEEDIANIANFPPAIDLDGNPRCVLDDIRIVRSWDGIDATGNIGGTYFGRIECGSLNLGLHIDGALDFVQMADFHFWLFGMSEASGLGLVYRNNPPVAVRIGRADNFSADKIAVFRARVELVGTSGGASWISLHISSLALDGNDSRLVVTGRTTQVSACYSTKDNVTEPTIDVSGGLVIIDNYRSGYSGSESDIKVTGGRCQINGGLLNQLSVSQHAAEVTDGVLELRNTHYEVPATPRTVGYIKQSGTGVLHMSGCSASSAGANGPLVEIGDDNTNNFVSGNHFGGWALKLPATIDNGCYGPNRARALTWTPVLEFATNGDFAPTYTFRQGAFRPTVDGIEFECRILFNTNAYTTASGTLRVLGLPFSAIENIDAAAMTMGPWSKVTLTGGRTQLTASISYNSDILFFREAGSGVAYRSCDTANFPASTSNIEISVSGVIRTL